MKNWNRNWKKILILLVLVVLLAFAVLMYTKVSELTNQLSYLQDTTNIILSDVGGMQSRIEKTLEEEASMIEDYSIEVTNMDFARKVYDVDISVIPKEYTDNTKVSIYFGTTECTLKADGYIYKGNVTLPLDKTFDGNVTFLLANGKKKTTEVVEDFDGMSGKFEQVLTGSFEGTPSLKDDRISLKGKCNYTLDNASLYTFKSFEIVASLDDQEIWTQNLMQDIIENNEEPDAQQQGLITTEQAQETDSEASTIESGSGTVDCKMSYEMQKPQGEDVDSTEVDTLPEKQQLRVYLRAVTSEGYRFETDLIRETIVKEEEKCSLDKESFDSHMYRSVYDKKGNKLEIDD